MTKLTTKFNMYATNVIFIVLDVLGLSIILLYYFVFHSEPLITLGLTFITLGLTIPISLYFQSKQNSDTFEIINAANKYGIENIFEGRKDSSANNRLKERIDDSFANTKHLYLLGIAFPELLDPETSSGSIAKRRIKNTEVDLKIIVLNPDSDAAKRRAVIEDPDNICEEGETICNIRNTIDNHTKLILRGRLENKYGKNWKEKIMEIKSKYNDENEFQGTIIKDIKMEIKFTDFDPISFIIATDQVLFSEQYSFGRPDSMESTATCIGGYLPVIQYKKLSKGYEFLKSHFDYIWNNTEKTHDATRKHLKFIIDRISP